jgi:hypothetical protein
MKTKTLVTAFALLAAGLVANANPVLTVTTGTYTGYGTITSPGVDEFNGPIGNWTLNVDTGTTKPNSGSPWSPYMDLATDNEYNGKTPIQPITISFSDWGFLFDGVSSASIADTLPKGWSLLFTLSEGSTTLISESFTARGSKATQAVGGDFNGLSTFGCPYGLCESVTITPTGKGQTSGDQTAYVPDGGMTLAMLGSVLAGVAGLRSKLGKRA